MTAGMIRIANKYSLLLLIQMSVVLSYAQQQPMFTQYMFNGLVLNPAYAGAQETFTATAIMRKQWVGIEGSPQTQTFSAHSPLDYLRNKKRPGSPVSVGLTIFRDEIAITTQSGLLASYAYRLTFTRDASLSFGLQAGINQFRIRYSNLELDDPSFSMGDVTEWQPDFGAGLYYQAKQFYAGFSAPQMLRMRTDLSRSSPSLEPHYFFTSGFIFDINKAVKLKPSMLIRNFSGDVFQFDVNCNVFLKETVNLGISWRSFESVSALMQFQVHERFGIGYAYDIPYGSEISRLSTGSHEIMVNYRVPRKKIRTINPRYF